MLAWDVFLGLALLFAALVFDGGGTERSERRLLFGRGVLCLGGAIGSAVGDMRSQLAHEFADAVVFPVVASLLVRLFAREVSHAGASR
ncbi:MAG: hypothetical protein HC897_07540 [Thermoanaerobaculia bacterium]|nr:hypothetical protein [Thermoanaerobaculia bacterium]